MQEVATMYNLATKFLQLTKPIEGLLPSCLWSAKKWVMCRMEWNSREGVKLQPSTHHRLINLNVCIEHKAHVPTPSQHASSISIIFYNHPIKSLWPSLAFFFFPFPWPSLTIPFHKFSFHGQCTCLHDYPYNPHLFIYWPSLFFHATSSIPIHI